MLQIFREATAGEEGLRAYSVKDIAAQLDIPAFDFVKIDIEGGLGAFAAAACDRTYGSAPNLPALCCPACRRRRHGVCTRQ